MLPSEVNIKAWILVCLGGLILSICSEALRKERGQCPFSVSVARFLSAKL